MMDGASSRRHSLDSTRKRIRGCGCCGSCAARATSIIGVNRQFKGWLKSQGVEFTEEEVPEMGHVWPLWRQNLTDMAPRLFQPKGK